MTDEVSSAFRREIPKARYALLAVISASFLLAVWSALSYGGLANPLFLPSPTRVLAALVGLFRDYAFASDVWISTYRILLGFVVSALFAIPVGILMGTSRQIEALVEPVNDFIRYLPVVAFVPLCILWVGIGDSSKVLVIFIGTYFQLVLMIADEAQEVRTEFVEMALTHGATKRQILWHVVVPASLPGIVDSLRIAMAWAWSYLVVAELVAAETGIGFKIMQGLRFLKTDQVMAAMLVLGLLGLSSDLIFKTFYRWWFRWKELPGE